MRRVKVGVIGLGEVAQIIHLPILEALSDRYELAAICDISAELIQKIGTRYGVHRRYVDALELAAQRDLDAVFVLNSDEYHAECTVAAARNGKHVLVEKPMCLAPSEAEAIIRARDEGGVRVMVAYMRRFAPAFTRAVEELPSLGRIHYARIRDIIGKNALIVEQSSAVHRPDDAPSVAVRDRRERADRLVREAIGEASGELQDTYRFLCGLNSHDTSAMRELLGVPRRVVSAVCHSGNRFLTVIFEYESYCAMLETGVDSQRRFDAHIEVYGEHKSLRVQYDTPYIRHLPTTLHVHETTGDEYNVAVHRPTFKDPYTHELEYFHDVVTRGVAPKTSPEDYLEDLTIFRKIIDALRYQAQSTSAQTKGHDGITQ